MNPACTKYLISLLLPFLQISHAAGQNTPAMNHPFIDSVIKKYQGQPSITYSIRYTYKPFSWNKPIRMEGNCKLVRVAGDTLLGGMVWYKSMDSLQNLEKVYSIHHSLLIDHTRKEVTRYDVSMGQVYQITGDFDGEMINTYFLRPDRLKEIMNEKGNIISIVDTILDEERFVVLKVYFEDSEEFTNGVKCIYFNRSTYNIEKISFSINDGKTAQTNLWELSRIVFGETSAEEISGIAENLPLGYRIVNWKEPEFDEAFTLIGKQAPPFTGKAYPHLLPVSNAMANHKICILDFWYLACRPCMKAIPILTHLSEKYSKDLVIMGLNPFDGIGNKSEKLSEFVSEKSLKYPIIFIDSAVVKSYKIHSYPTLFVIDQSGVIRKCHLGFSEDLEKDLEEVIEKLLHE